VLLLDTCVLIFDALAPDKLSKRAAAELATGRVSGTLASSDITLWEIAMLAARGRISVKQDVAGLIRDIVLANRLAVIPISPEIATLAADDHLFPHKDPADRIIAATALTRNAPLITCDSLLTGITGLKTIW
jgi:PIN domain nuclease of toxin-antitoxin system